MSKESYKAWWKSPYSPKHSSKAEVAKLYQLLKKYVPDQLHDSQLSKEKVFRKIIPAFDLKNKKHNSDARKISSELYLLGEDFIVHQQMTRRSQNKTVDQFSTWNVQLVEGLAAGNHYDFFVQENEQLLQSLEAHRPRRIEDYNTLQQLYHLQAYHADTNKQKSDVPFIKKALERLDYFFVLTKLKYICELANRQRMYQTPSFPIFNKKEVLQFARQPQLKTQEPLFFIYAQSYDLLTQQDMDSYTALKDFFAPRSKEIAVLEQRFVFQHLINFCVSQLRNNMLYFRKEMLELYLLEEQNDVLLYQNRITSTAYMNMIISATLLKENDLAHRLKKQYAPHLNPNQKPNIVHLVEAYCCFHQKDFEQAVLHAEQIPKPTLAYLVCMKEIKLRAAYELHLRHKQTTSLTPIQYGNQAFQQFLFRKKDEFSPSKYHYYDNFTKIFAKILESKSFLDKGLYSVKAEQATLQKYYNSHQPAYLYYWLQEKIDTL